MIITNAELKEMIEIAMLGKYDTEVTLNIRENGILWRLNEDVIYRTQGEHDFDIGEYKINSKQLTKIIKSLPKGTSELTIKDKTLIISDDTGDLKAKLTDGEKIEVPNVTERLIRLNAGEFIEILKEAKEFMSKDKSRQVFESVFLDYKKIHNELKIVALDGYRMYVKTIKLKDEDQLDSDFNLIMKKEAVERIKKNKNSNVIEIQKGTNKKGFEENYIRLENAMIENGFLTRGEYIAYESIINTDFTYKTEYGEKTIKDIIKYLEKCKKFGDKSTLVESEIVNNKHILTCNVEGTEITKEFNANVKDRFKIAYNSQYMLDALNIFKEERNTEIWMKNEVSGIFFKTEDKLVLVLPIELKK